MVAPFLLDGNDRCRFLKVAIPGFMKNLYVSEKNVCKE